MQNVNKWMNSDNKFNCNLYVNFKCTQSLEEGLKPHSHKNTQRMEAVSVNGSLQSWPVVTPLNLREMLLQPSSSKTLFFQRETEDVGTSFALQDLMQQAQEWDLVSRFKLDAGDVVIVQSPNWLANGVVAVLGCLENKIPVLPLSMDVPVGELYSIFKACITGLNKLCFLSTREKLWEADYLLAQFHCVSGSLGGGEGDWPPPTCVSDLTCKTDPKLPKHYSKDEEEESACVLFYDAVTRTLLEATERNVVAFALTARSRNNNQVWKLHGLAWLGSILPFLCSSNKDDTSAPLLFAAKRQVSRIRRVHTAVTAVQAEQSHLVELMLGLDQSKCDVRLSSDQLLVFGPCSFRQTLSKSETCSSGYVLDQSTFTWWFAVDTEPGTLRLAQDGMTIVPAFQQQPKKLHLVKPVRRPTNATARL